MTEMSKYRASSLKISSKIATDTNRRNEKKESKSRITHSWGLRKEKQ